MHPRKNVPLCQGKSAPAHVPGKVPLVFQKIEALALSPYAAPVRHTHPALTARSLAGAKNLHAAKNKPGKPFLAALVSKPFLDKYIKSVPSRKQTTTAGDLQKLFQKYTPACSLKISIQSNTTDRRQELQLDSLTRNTAILQQGSSPLPHPTKWKSGPRHVPLRCPESSYMTLRAEPTRLLNNPRPIAAFWELTCSTPFTKNSAVRFTYTPKKTTRSGMPGLSTTEPNLRPTTRGFA